MKTLQEQYIAIKNGKGNKAQFVKHARSLFPEYFNQYTDFDTAANVLKSKQIISEAAGGVVGKGFDIWDWKKILAEETKAVEKETSKEVLDDQKNNYNNKDMKNADNVNFNEIMKGFYCEMKDPANKDKTGDELKAMVVKNLAKDPLYYTKNGEFGTKGVGYTDEAPGLGKNTQPTSKTASVLGGSDEVDSKSDVVKNSLVGTTKKVKLKENKEKIKLQESFFLNLEDAKEEAQRISKEEGVVQHVNTDGEGYSVEDWYDSDNTVVSYEGGRQLEENIESLEEQKLRSLIRNIIKEELNETESSIKKGDILYHKSSGATLEVTNVNGTTINMKVTKVKEDGPKYIKVGQPSKTNLANIGKTYIKK